MLSTDERKGRDPEGAGVRDLAIPKSARAVAFQDNDPSARIQRRDRILDFNKNNPTVIDPARPEIGLVTIALSFARRAMVDYDARSIITLQTEQLKRAFRSFAEGCSVIEMVDQILGEALFPEDLRPLIDDYRYYLRRRLETNELLRSLGGSSPPTESLTARRAPFSIEGQRDVAGVCEALDFAAERILADLSRPRPGNFGSEATSRPDLQQFVEILRAGELEEQSRRPRDTQNQFPTIDYQGLERHLLGVLSDPGRVGVMVSEDVGWVASVLMFHGYSSDVVIAGILLHAHNSLTEEGDVWMRDVAERLSDDAPKLLSIARAATPDPIRTPEKVTVLNCQRPLQLVKGGEDSLMNGARAIAAASVLSPSYGAKMDEVLDVVPFLRESGTPEYFKTAVKTRCLDLGRSEELTRLARPSDGKRLLSEIRGVLEHFQLLYPARTVTSGDTSLLRTIHYATKLAFNLISEKAPLMIMSEGFVDPFFGSLSQSTRAAACLSALCGEAFSPVDDEQAILFPANVDQPGKKLSEVSDEEARAIIEGMSSNLVIQIPGGHRALRWQSGMLTSLDFRAAPEIERYQAFVQQLGVPSSDTRASGRPLTEFLSERGEMILERVLRTYGEWEQRRARNKNEAIEEIVRILRNGGFQSPDLESYIDDYDPTADEGRLYARAARFMAECSLSANELGLWTTLRALQFEAVRPAARVIIDEEAATRTISSFIRTEASKRIQRWDATHTQKVIALSLGLTPAGAKRELIYRSLYTADELERFSLASEKMINVLRSIEATGTPRNQAQSYRHCMEVAMTLALAGASSDVVIAGILHDLYELVVNAERANKGEIPQLAQTRKEVREVFGGDVDKLVDLVSEVRSTNQGNEPPFVARKMAIFQKVMIRYGADPVLARKAVTVLLAAKVSTLSEGLLAVMEVGESQPWSKGDYLDNLAVMMATRQLADKLCQRNAIMELFDQQIDEWRKAADIPSLQVRKGLAKLWGTDMEEADPSRAIPLLVDAARGGALSALHHLGVCYRHGHAVPQSASLAARLLNFSRLDRESRDGLFRFREFDLAELKKIYECATPGDELDQEKTAVVTYLLENTERGDPGAEYQVGLCYLHGWGVPKAPLAALDRFKRAASLLEGVKRAIELGRKDGVSINTASDDSRLLYYVLSEIGKMYEFGVAGAPADPEQAFACYNFFSDAQPPVDEVLASIFTSLAQMHREGRGTHKDEDLAKRYELRAEQKVARARRQM